MGKLQGQQIAADGYLNADVLIIQPVESEDIEVEVEEEIEVETEVCEE
jgi:hypothetical protein